jgi:hypothetical protein
MNCPSLIQQKRIRSRRMRLELARAVDCRCPRIRVID